MERFFNTAGPIIPTDHYHIPSFERVDWDEIQNLIARKRYFLLHAPRQTGKTSALLEMMQALNEVGKYRALYANIEGAQAARNDVEAGIATVCNALVRSADVYLQEKRLSAWLNAEGKAMPAQDRFSALLAHWAGISDKPIVLFLDEADALIGDTLVSLLRQIRAGYAQRPNAFPQSIVLCGLRDIKDYRIHVANGDVITGGSAFNIKAKSLRLGNFSEAEVRALYQQHTTATGQTFAEAIFVEAWADTRGQPWLVNALAHEMTWEDRAARDRATPITLERYLAARERLIYSRATHLDQLTDKLREPRVHGVISALLSGEQTELLVPHDDLQYVEDLGLIVRKPQLHISNRIYREVIPRELTSVTQDTMVQQQSWYLTPDRHLDMAKLLAAFQQFFRENSESWIERFDYKEAGPQLLMQAFLQRIINGGGRINREYGLGRRRTDLLIEWPVNEAAGFHGEVQRIVIELKLQHGTLEAVLDKGLEQTADYADKCRADEAHLLLFNRNPNVSWDDKIWRRTLENQGRSIDVWGA
ncbi:MAG: AAA-like domain-containing protein [Pseudomonadota bacterium]|nr:AAA-like domain-containing protein [Pseudomonadota bacterium]